MNIPIYLQIVALLAAVIMHEVAHGWVADRLGDPTARLAGRISLNPLVHLDLYGSILLPLLLIIIRSPFIFGWAKPVPFDPYNLKNPRRDSALISLAGPISNLSIAIVCSALIRLTGSFLSPLFLLYTPLLQFLWAFVVINVALAIFNLIPIHPLDGGKIFIGLLPESQAHEADLFLRRYGMIILFLLIFPTIGGASPVFIVLGPIIDFILKILLAGNSLV